MQIKKKVRKLCKVQSFRAYGKNNQISKAEFITQTGDFLANSQIKATTITGLGKGSTYGINSAIVTRTSLSVFQQLSFERLR